MELGSQQIDNFLKYIREVKQQYSMAKDEEQECTLATQDLLHSLELDKHTYHEYARIAKKLAVVRQKRREAKNTMLVLQSVEEWIETNNQTISRLESVLGATRKAEKNVNREGKVYILKTSVLKELNIDAECSHSMDTMN